MDVTTIYELIRKADSARNSEVDSAAWGIIMSLWHGMPYAQPSPGLRNELVVCVWTQNHEDSQLLSLKHDMSCAELAYPKQLRLNPVATPSTHSAFQKMVLH